MEKNASMAQIYALEKTINFDIFYQLQTTHNFPKLFPHNNELFLDRSAVLQEALRGT